MAVEKKDEQDVIDLRSKVTLFAPKGAKYHAEGEEVKIHPAQKDHFKKHGFTETAPKSK